MSTEEMINALRALEEKHKDDKVSTFDTRWADVCHDTANRLEELSNALEEACFRLALYSGSDSAVIKRILLDLNL